METVIPIHDFYEEDDFNVPIRYIPLVCREDYDDALPHRHNYFEMFFFTKGGGNHYIDFKDFEIQDFSIHLIYPRQVHQLRRAPGSHGCVVHFTEDIYHTMDVLNLFANHADTALSLSEKQYAELWAILVQLQYEYNRDEKSIPMLKGYLHLLLLRCMEIYNKSPLKNDKAYPEGFIKFRQLAEKEFRTHKSPGWYALSLEMEDWQLNKLCRAATGLTPGIYIKNLLLLEAKRLLYNSQLSIKEISYYLGFEDPSYFNRFFKKNLGITAGEFRQKTNAR